MNTRKLGRTDLEVPVVSFGAWAIGGWAWGGTDDDAAVAAIRAGIDAGMSAIDTAPVYGLGHSEQVVGRAIAGRRAEVLVMTKVGLRWDDDRGEPFFEMADASGERRRVCRNARPDSVRLEVERSLERLGIERIDLIQVHWPDSTTPIAETMGALAELRDEGKVREIGVSNYTVKMLAEAQRALGDVPLASDQPQYSLVARGIEADVLPYAREAEVAILAYSPLEQGLLTGAVGPEREFSAGDGRAQRATFRPENRRRVNAVLERVVRPIATEHAATLAQVIIAWTVAQPGVTSALVGARRPEQARENAAAGALELTPGEFAAIDRAFGELRLLPARSRGVRARLTSLVRRVFSAR